MAETVGIDLDSRYEVHVPQTAEQDIVRRGTVPDAVGAAAVRDAIARDPTYAGVSVGRLG